jgi:chorismate mutase
MTVDITATGLSLWPIHSLEKFFIAGPCSVESEKQIHEAARQIAKLPVRVLRGGVWKPRTRPGMFQGVGTVGLKWLREAGRANGLPVATEVASPDHVEACLKNEIDILWIGARTTVNPFSVQAIADSLKGVDVPVMVKNPLNPEIELWLGALERLNRAGVKRLAAIHRGFSSYRKTQYRNIPNWVIPLELRRRIPALPILCDPSHICGNTKLLLAVAQEAMDLLFDGLVIEVHPDPSSALSDAAQQLTPVQLGKLLAALKFKKATSDNQEIGRKIGYLRREIDEIDNHVIELLSQRMQVSRALGECKGRFDISTFQPQRWSEIMKTRVAAGVKRNLSKEFVENVYEHIHEESIRHQETAMGSGKNPKLRNKNVKKKTKSGKK